MALTYRWPTKVKKFGIEDPALKVLVAKYENEIPWQKEEIKDEDSLCRFIQNRMLPRLLNRVAFPPERSVKHCYVSHRNVDLEVALATDQELDRDDIDVVRLIKKEDGVEEATKALLEVINTRKASGFKQWTDLIGGKYLDDPAFCILLLRPLFDMSGHGSRRSVVPPSTDVIDWLYRRITQGRLSPNDNVAKVYCWKLSSGSYTVPANGWQYIATGMHNASQLSAACRGSGWCVASKEMASSYLNRSCFYILREEGKPVVALRAEPSGKTVNECQGRDNESPQNWFADIHFFLKAQSMVLTDRVDEMRSVLTRLGDLNAKSYEWWLERSKYWPFLSEFAPEDILLQLKMQGSSEITSYLGFPSFQYLAERSGVTMEPEDWTRVVEIDPLRFSQCPPKYRNNQEVRAACIRGWKDRIQDGEITLEEITSIDGFVCQDAGIREALNNNFADELRKKVRLPSRTYDERVNPFDLERLMPVLPDEPAMLAVDRLVNLFLNNKSADFSDRIIPELIRNRDDFAHIRETAWLESLQAHPPLWFALPEDLKVINSFSLNEGEVTRVSLESWVLKVEQKPWLLTQQKTVPKSVRFHRRILEAYRDGWISYVKQAPWRIWVKRGLARRVYMSYGLLGDKMVIDAFTEGWDVHRKNVFSCWSKGSERMQDMPVLQVSALRAVCSRRNIRIHVQILNVCRDIQKRQNPGMSADSDNPFAAEIKGMLSSAGFL